MVPGVKLHCVFAGKPEHDMSTPPVYPLIGVTTKVVLAEPEVGTANVVGVFERTYVGASTETVTELEAEPAKPLSPL